MANTPESKVSRRTLAKGAAWAVPVVSAAAMAPSVAASPTVITTAPEGLALDLTACNAGTLSWTGLPDQTYEVQYRIEGSPDWKPSPPWQVTGTSRSISAGSTEYLREVQVRHYVSDAATSAWVTYTIPTPTFTGVTAQYVATSQSNQFYHRVSWDTLEFAGEYTVRVKTGNATSEITGLTSSSWTGLLKNRNQLMTEAQVETMVCGRRVTSEWVSFASALRVGGGGDNARQVGDAQRQVSTTDTQDKKTADAKPSAPKKPTPAEPKPTVAPEPKVTVAPEPAPIVSEAAPVTVPEPAASPTPAG